jgi:uncharacterized membrane-anchored protein
MRRPDVSTLFTAAKRVKEKEEKSVTERGKTRIEKRGWVGSDTTIYR